MALQIRSEQQQPKSTRSGRSLNAQTLEMFSDFDQAAKSAVFKKSKVLVIDGLTDDKYRQQVCSALRSWAVKSGHYSTVERKSSDGTSHTVALVKVTNSKSGTVSIGPK